MVPAGNWQPLSPRRVLRMHTSVTSLYIYHLDILFFEVYQYALMRSPRSPLTLIHPRDEALPFER